MIEISTAQEPLKLEKSVKSKSDKNMFTLEVPLTSSDQLPNYLIDVLHNDPHFRPEIKTHSLEDAFLEHHKEKIFSNHQHDEQNLKENQSSQIKERLLKNDRKDIQRPGFCSQLRIVLQLTFKEAVISRLMFLFWMVNFIVLQSLGTALIGLRVIADSVAYEIVSVIVYVSLFNAFLGTTLSDYQSLRRHILRVTGKMSSTSYTIGASLVNYSLYMFMIAVQILVLLVSINTIMPDSYDGELHFDLMIPLKLVSSISIIGLANLVGFLFRNSKEKSIRYLFLGSYLWGSSTQALLLQLTICGHITVQ